MAKNHKGNSWGYDGFFWISYESPLFDVTAITDVTSRSDLETYIYEYDEFGKMSSLYENKTSQIYSNQFKSSNGKRQILNAVSTYTCNENNHMKFYIDADISDDIGPEEVGVKGYDSDDRGYVVDDKGYFVFELNEPVAVSSGFQVYVMIQNDNGVYIPIEKSISDYSSQVEVTQNVGYLGEELDSLSVLNTDNICLKAFTENDTNAKNMVAYTPVTFTGSWGRLINDVYNDNSIAAPIVEVVVPKATSTVKLEITAVVKPEATPTTKPEATPTAESEAMPTTKPEATSTVKPTTSVKQKFNLSVKASKKWICISWAKIKGADGYYVYGAECGQKIKKINKSSTIRWTQKGLKKGHLYKYYIKAFKKSGKSTKKIGTSISVHIATAGGKYTNAKKIKTSFSRVTLKVGGKKQINASIIKQKSKKKIVNHTDKYRYLVSDKKILKVSKKSLIRTAGKGKCYIYANDGVFKRIQVTVK